MPRRPKGQHFLLTSAARTLSLATVMRLSPREAETLFAAIRWSATGGRPVCPGCACDAVYDCRRATGAPRWRCKACRKDFTLTSGTLFAFHKLPLVLYLAAIVIFVNEVKGKSALALSRDLDVQYKTAFVLAHKIREAMAAEMKGGLIGGAAATSRWTAAMLAVTSARRMRRRTASVRRHVKLPPWRHEELPPLREGDLRDGVLERGYSAGL